MLDVGCGAGQTLIAAYPDRMSFGVDINFGALRLGQSLTSHVRFVHSDGTALPFMAGQFDMVVARVSLPYMNILACLSEMRRVLKPNGSVWLALHPLAIPLRQARRAGYKGKIWFLYVLLNGLCLHFFQRQFGLLGKYESFQTERGIRRALERSGFGEVAVSRTRQFIVTARAVVSAVPAGSAASRPATPIRPVPGRSSSGS